MTYFQWSPEYEVGMDVIDYQHRRLVQLINDLHEYSQKQSFKEGLIEVIFQELAQYARYHFSVEEQLMEKVDYINFGDHQRQHENFVKRLEEMWQEHNTHESDPGDRLLEFLKNWLRQHILKEDLAIAQHVTNREGMV